jgi:hypothetical protein
LPSRGNLDPAKGSLRLADVNLFWWKINVGAQVGELGSIGFLIRCLEWKNDLRIAHIECVEERLMMDERSVIDIERDLADQGQCVLAILVIKNPHIFCDETTKRVQRQTPDAGFDSVLAQFLYYAVAPLTAKSSLGEVIAAAANPKNCAKNHEAHEGHGDAI